MIGIKKIYRSGRLKFLIVEDDFKSRMQLQKMLSTFAECDVVVNGQEAVEAFKLAHEAKSPYHLICLDIMMPEMDGKEALKAIRCIEKEKRLLKAQKAIIFMVTALDTEKDVIQSIRNQCSDYILKPIDRKKLVKKMREHGLI